MEKRVAMVKVIIINHVLFSELDLQLRFILYAKRCYWVSLRPL